jgi:predicted transcriptional regulator YdeE
MEPTIVTKQQIFLLGFSFFGDPFKISAGWTEENEIGRLWKRFMSYWTHHRDHIPYLKTDQVMYEMHIEHTETHQTGEYEVFVGVEMTKLAEVPVELAIKILPPATYAVFTLTGAEIASDWSKMMAEWMAQAGYRRAYPYGFQRYDERFKGLDRIEESTLDVYVPIVPIDRTGPAE